MKKALVLILCFAMLLTLIVGCTPQNTTAPTTAPTGGTTATTPEATTTLGPPVELTYVFPVFADHVDTPIVNAALNEIALAKANVKVTMNPIAISSYSGQVPMMITGGEDIDLLLTLPGGPTLYATMVAQGQLNDITELLPQYAPGIVDAFNAVNKDFLNGAYVGGKMFGVPTLFDKVTGTYFDFRKDVLVENGLLDAFKAIKNMNDLEAIVKVLSEKSDIPVLCATGNSWGQVVNSNARLINFDDFSKQIVTEFFSSDTWAYGAIVGTDNTKVINMYASDYYKKLAEKARDWYQKGYVSKDAATQVDMGGLVIKANGALGSVGDGELGHEAYVSSQAGKDMISVMVADAVVNTGIMQKFVWTLPVTCSDKEAALKFLELTYTDADIVNLLNFGIKDTHYVENTDGTISLPAGVEPGKTRYHVNAPFLFGSAYLAKVATPDPADLRQQALAVNKAATAAPLLGFAVDTSKFTDEYTAVINVITQYSPGLNAGSSDPAELTKFLAALDSAGMPKILAAVQAQVDAFVAAKK